MSSNRPRDLPPSQPPRPLSPSDPRVAAVIRLLEEEEARLIALRAQRI